MALREAHLTPQDPVVQVFDVQRNGKKIFLGRYWETPGDGWRWESYYGGNCGNEPNAEACRSLLWKVACDTTLTIEDAQ